MMHLLATPQVTAIERILDTAHKSGRGMLFENEVYAILNILGLLTPQHRLVRSETEITAPFLAQFGSKRIVLKIVSSAISHKQKENGVRIIYKDLAFVKFSFTQIQQMFQAKGLPVEGILFCEHIDYSRDLGNEILLGFRESESFGPVISFSKGGSDAEHFATHFSSPNLILAPIDRTWAQALLASTHIREKYLAEGHLNYLKTIVDVQVVLSHLATCFSNFFETSAQFVFKEFEINPFVFDPDGRFIALDGFASFERPKHQRGSLAVKNSQTLKPFFNPQGIVVAGLSRSDMTKAGNIIFSNLLKIGRSDVYGVNIKGGKIKVADHTHSLYRSVSEIPHPVDLAVITVPAAKTVPIVKDCAAKGIKAIILIPGGFSESNQNAAAEDQIEKIARMSQIRIMGPNCLGIIRTGDPAVKSVNTFFIPEEKFRVHLKKDSNVAILSQSGALGINEIHNLRNAISPRVIVSYGNQLDVDPGDLIHYLNHDPQVDVIGCYVEGFKEGAGRKLFNIAKTSAKPIIIYKAGRTEHGIRAAQSHTASMAGEYRIAKAAMKQAGMIVAETMIDHGDFIKIFTLLKDFPVTGKKVAIIANAGYEKTYAADNLLNLDLASLSDETIKVLEEILPPFVKADPMLDLTPMADDDMYARCIEWVLRSETVDALFISIVPYGSLIHTTDKEIDGYQANIAAQIVDLVHRYKKPTVVSINVVSGADAAYNRFGQILDSGGVPTYLTADRAMICLNAFIGYHLTRQSQTLSEWLK